MFKNKIAGVTGAGSGIGQAVALRLAKEGASVALLDINEKGLAETQAMIEEIGGRALPLVCDITSRANVFESVEKMHSTLGAIDLWVNCAGYSKIIPTLECPEEIWDRTLDINLKGMFLCCQAAISHFNPEGGAIVNFSSESGKKGTNCYAAYCASKFGVRGLTQALSSEFAPVGIRVNCVCPGVVITPMWDAQVADYAKKRNIKPEEVMPRFKNNIPLHRLCELDEVCDLVTFLLSDKSSYMTGQSINITGGNTMY